MPRIVVVGSINMDLVTLAPRFPGPGETLLGTRFFTTHGGKGANQAVAAARLGAQVTLVGALGHDAFGDQLHAGLAREGIDLTHVARFVDAGSGTASITVAASDNAIIVVPGANARVTPAQVEAARGAIAGADAVLVQLEIPLETVAATLRLGRKENVPVLLNPAPAQPLPADWLALAAAVTPNQHELATALGAGAGTDFRELMRACPCPVVLTRGGEGAWWRDAAQPEPQHQPGFAVDVVDTTGAGDTFNGALAVFLHEGMAAAARKACAAAALSVTRLGAQGGMPTARELDRFLAAH